MKRIKSAFVSLILSVGSLMAFAPMVAHAAAPYTCTWTGAGGNSNFSTAGNWSGCNSAAPVATDNDNFVFNGTATSFTPNNDLTNLSVGSITISGANPYTFTGNAFTITGGIVENSTSLNGDQFKTNVTFTGNQSITGTQTTSLVFGLSGGTNTLTISSGTTLTIGPSYTGQVSLNSAMAGSGTLAVNGGTFLFPPVASSFTGPINIGAGGSASAQPVSGLGTGAITIASGGYLSITDSTNATINNALTIAGTGTNGQGALFTSVGPGCTSACSLSDTLTWAGAVTLTGNTSVDPNFGTIKITGAYNAGGFTLTAKSGQIIIGSTVISSNGTASRGGGTTAKTPSTGFGLAKDQPLLALGGAILIGGTLIALAWNSHKPAHTRR